MPTIEIFFSYSHEDEEFRSELEKHLSLLKRQGLIAGWHDQMIVAGKESAGEINAHLNTAQIILLLISPDFMNSDYCYSIEMQRAMERHEAGEAVVIPIILRPIDWKGALFGKLHALPDKGIPVTRRRNRDDAFLEIATGIRKSIEELLAKAPKASSGFSNSISHKVSLPIGLPRPTTFIGRDAYLDKLMDRLRRGETSGIFALNGMGGVGKTAIAAETMARLLEDQEAFPGGGVWISCEDLVGSKGLREIWKQLALVIGVDLTIADPDLQRIMLARALARSPNILIALDNIEPQLGVDNNIESQLGVDILLDTLAIPGHTTLLITSRHVLVPQRLTSFMIPPLSEQESTQLFIQRLKQINDNPPFADDNRYLSHIIVALGGLPLAIELVAAYAGIQQMPLFKILEELEKDKIAANSLNFDSRRALISRFDRSWNVLSSREQRLFAGLSLLRSSSTDIDFPREAAVALVFAALDDQERASIFGSPFEDLSDLDYIYRSLADPNFLRQAEQDVAKLVAYALIEPLPESMRLRMHPLLREYAAERLFDLPLNIIKKFNPIIKAFWLKYKPHYGKLGGIEADSIWDARQEQLREEMSNQMTSAYLPTPSKYSELLWELGTHLMEQGEVELGKARMLESGKLIASQEELGKQRLEAEQKAESILVVWIKKGKANSIGQVWQLSNKPLIIGRDPGSDICLSESAVSRHHAMLFPLNKRNYVLRDKDSKNGTFLNSKPIIQRRNHTLHPGDIIQIGSTVLAFDTYNKYFASTSVDV